MDTQTMYPQTHQPATGGEETPPDQPSGQSRPPMSDAHKKALATGRAHSRIVRNYLTALESHRPRRGRKRTVESIDRRLGLIDFALDNGVDPLRRVQLLQERLDLRAEREALVQAVDLKPLEDEFVEVAAAYSRAKGLSFAAWREAGVPVEVLTRAGLGR